MPTEDGVIDEVAPARPVAKTDRRLDCREPINVNPDSEKIESQEHHAVGIFNLFARTKYWAATKGPRQPGKRPDDLQRATELLRDALEMTWRAGYKGEDLGDSLLGMLPPK